MFVLQRSELENDAIQKNDRTVNNMNTTAPQRTEGKSKR